MNMESMKKAVKYTTMIKEMIEHIESYFEPRLMRIAFPISGL